MYEKVTFPSCISRPVRIGTMSSLEQKSCPDEGRGTMRRKGPGVCGIVWKCVC
jgi:hypothetical protein